MDAETQRRKRQEALDEKKKRLEEMKRNKGAREATAASSLSSVPSSSSVASSIAAVPVKDERVDVDDLVNSLLVSNISKVTLTESNNPVTAANPSSQEGTQAPAPFAASSSSRKPAVLSIVKGIATVQILPIEREFYEKETQTDDLSDEDEQEGSSLHVFTEKTPMKRISHRRPARSTRSDSVDASIEPSSNGLGSPTNNRRLSGGQVPPPPPADRVVPATLSEQQKVDILKSPSFTTFLDSSSRVIERALAAAANVDILKNYRVDANDSSSHGATNHHKIMNALSFFDDESVRFRPVMDLQFSPHHGELFLAAYGSRQAPHATNPLTQRRGSAATGVSSASASYLQKFNEDDPLGMCCVWSTVTPQRPEFKFVASSPVLTARFHEEEQRLIFGGCYTGQILLWDMRAKSLPVQRTSLSGKGHKHPVYSMAMSSSPTELITVSTDGTLCHWDTSQLAEPTHVIQLQTLTGNAATTGNSGAAGSGAAAANASMVLSSAAFSTAPDGGYKAMYFGAGTGLLCKGHLPIRATDKIQQVPAHGGPITSMRMNPSTHRMFRGLLLTASVDWTTKLWNLGSSRSPVFEFFNTTYDYISDVQWNPVNPGLFSTVASGGNVTLWNIFRSTTEPVGVLNVNQLDGEEVSSTSSQSGSGRGLTIATGSTVGSTHMTGATNTSAWSSDGALLLVGNARGVVQLISVAESSIKYTPADESKLEMLMLNSLDLQAPTTSTLPSGELTAASVSTPKEDSEAV